MKKPRRNSHAEAAQRIWTDKGYRVFLSHKAEMKVDAARLKEGLTLFGITAFVAHENIGATREWQREIESALRTMHAFVALLTKSFHSSKWTDQEVGYALGRDVPVIAVKLGLDPYGFIGKFQALKCTWEDAPIEIAKLLIRYPRMVDAYIDATTECRTFEQGNQLARLLPYLDALTGQQIERLISAFSLNHQVQGSFGFEGSYRSKFGPGLAFHLARITGRAYLVTGDWPRKQIKLKRQ